MPAWLRMFLSGRTFAKKPPGAWVLKVPKTNAPAFSSATNFSVLTKRAR